MLDAIRSSLETVFPKPLVDELLRAYTQLKQDYYAEKHAPSEVEGGKFSEAVFRMLEFVTTGSYTALGRTLNTESVIINLQNIPHGAQPESVRIHIPRTLRVMYDIRSKRDAVHLADGIDPNFQDSTFVSASADWVMAELVRLYHGVQPQEAQRIVDALVEKKCPLLQEFDDVLKTLVPSWGPAERIKAVLYHRGEQGATSEELASSLKPNQRPNIQRTLDRLEYDTDEVHQQDGLYFITRRGALDIEASIAENTGL